MGFSGARKPASVTRIKLAIQLSWRLNLQSAAHFGFLKATFPAKKPYAIEALKKSVNKNHLNLKK